MKNAAPLSRAVEGVEKVILCYTDAIEMIFWIIKTPHPREAYGEVLRVRLTQGKFIPINFDEQIFPGTFEHTDARHKLPSNASKEERNQERPRT